MAVVRENENLEKVYSEASQWIRMVNIIEWTMAGLFVPLSFGCFPLAKTHPELKTILAIASIVLFGLWVYISFLYSWSGRIARDALQTIEAQWGLEFKIAFYTRQGKPSTRWWGIRVVNCVMLLALAVAWLVYLSL